MVRDDPHGDADPRYECMACGHRETDADVQPLVCGECGGSLRNIGVPRDQ